MYNITNKSSKVGYDNCHIKIMTSIYTRDLNHALNFIYNYSA